jgi:hypothetical protein
MGLRGTKNNVIGFNEKVYLDEQNIFFFSCVHELESYSFDCNKKLVTIISYQSKVPNNNKSINNNLIQSAQQQKNQLNTCHHSLLTQSNLLAISQPLWLARVLACFFNNVESIQNILAL